MDSSLCCVAFIVIFLVLLVTSMYQQRQRRRALHAARAERDWGFDPEARHVPATFAEMPLMQAGHGGEAENLLIIPDEAGHEYWLFDYSYETGDDDDERTHLHTVFGVPRLPVGLPEFDLSPEGGFSGLGAWFGFEDIDFPAHPEFSRRFRLRGANETAVRTLFNRRLLGILELVPTLDVGHELSIQGSGRRLLIFYPGRTQSIDDLVRLPGLLQPLASAIVEAAGGAPLPAVRGQPPPARVRRG